MIYRFKFEGNDNAPLIEETSEFEARVWRKTPEYIEVDVNGNKMPSHEELIEYWNKQHAKKGK